MTANSDISKVLNDYAYFWSIGDLSRAAAVLDTSLRQTPAEMELWWYRLCALEKLGQAGPVQAGLEAMAAAENAQAGRKIRAPRYPGEKGTQALASFQGRESGPPTLFALTLESASADLCRLFLERLGIRRLPALCLRLIALEPASAPDLISRAQQYLSGVKTRLDEALTELKALLVARPADPRPLIRIAGLWQVYEDGFEAWNRLSGAAPGRTGSMLADFIEESSRDVLDKSRRGPKSDLDDFRTALKTIVESLRAAFPLQWACQNFLGFDPRDQVDPAAWSTFSEKGREFILNFKMLAVARNIFYLSHQRLIPVVPVDPAEQTAANRGFMEQLEKSLRPQGYRFLGLFEQEALSEAMNMRITPGAFLSPCRRILVIAFSVKPKWSNWLEWLIGTLTGHLRNHKVLGSTSLMTDGRVLSVVRSSLPNYFDQSPLLKTVWVSALTSPAGLVQKHEEILRQYQSDSPGVGCRSFNGPGDLNEVLLYQAQVENEFRRTMPDYVSQGELRRMLKFNYNQWHGKIIAHLKMLDQVYQRASADLDAQTELRP